MKKFNILALLLFAAVTLQAQEIYDGDINYDALVIKSGDYADVSLDAYLQSMTLKRQQMVVIAPAVVSFDGTRRVELPKVVVAGPKRYKAVKRDIFYRRSQFDDRTILVRYNNTDISGVELKNGKVNVSQRFDFAEWMREAKFTVKETVGGCASCTPNSTDKILSERVLPEPFVPRYSVSYVTPPAESVKQRSETHISRLNYMVGRSNLLHDYKDNAAVLDDVAKIMNELSSNKDLTISRIHVVGYASPEGSTAGNQALSEARAKSFLDFLHTKYGLNISNATSEGRGEDWDGLYKEVSSSADVPDKNNVLDIIKNTSDVTARKSKLQALGSTYRYLLDNLYPPLRRNEYEISYVARAFNVQEAANMIKTRPQLLSLNEMFLVANSYPKNSDDFKNVFDVAVRMYPADNYAIVNAAAMEIESGAVDKGIERLGNINTPEALNNLGVAYAKKGDLTRAEDYLRRAAAAGQPAARTNLEQLARFRAEN